MRGFYFRHVGRRMSRKLTFILILLGIFAVIVYAMIQLQPMIERLATTRVSNTVNRIVYEAVNEAIDSGQISYEQLIQYEKDNDGKVTMVTSNMAAFNRLQAQILDIILTRIDQVSARELSIALGSLTGSPLLAGRGPRIHIRMESVGSSTAQFLNEFSSAGINQTKHRIILEIDVYVSILLPAMTTATKVSNHITVAETVIVGAVPDSYTYFSTPEKTYENDIKDYILNNA